MSRESGIESRPVSDKELRLLSYRKITDWVDQHGIRIGRENVRLIGCREGLWYLLNLQSSVAAASTAGKYPNRGIRAMCGVKISSLSGQKMARR